MNALQKLLREAKDAARHDLLSNDMGQGRSFPIRLRSGDTLRYFATSGPRGGIKLRREVTHGWTLDHPADFGKPSY